MLREEKLPSQGQYKIEDRERTRGVNKCVKKKFSIRRRVKEAVSADGREMMLLATINPSKMDLN